MTLLGAAGVESRDAIENVLREAGFSDVGFAGARRLDEEIARLEEWIGRGRHADMLWLARDPARRGTPPSWARTVIVALAAYPPLLWDGARERYASFAEGDDYHVRLKAMMRPALDLIERAGGRGTIHVDTGAVLEKAWAREAGLGFIGRNRILISRVRGPHVLIAVLFTDLALPVAECHEPESCGSCRRCLDACPGRALDDEGLDARRCLAWLTIEKKDATEGDLASARPWIHGCDVCLDVCPHAARSLPPVRPVRFARRRGAAEAPGQTGSGS